MKVLHLSTFDNRGGAALAAYRLHRAMLRRPECTSRMLVREKETNDPTVTQVTTSMSFPLRWSRFLERRRVQRELSIYAQSLAKVEMFSDDRGIWRDNIQAHLRGFEVIQLHWVCQFLNYRRFFATTPREVALVWRLADKNPFTGGCHYDGGCHRFEAACGRCPKLESEQENDLSRAIWKRKKAALDQLASDRLHIVALNHWMAKQVRDSSLFQRFECSVIPNGVDVEEFRPIPAAAARAALGIPDGQKVVAFVAESASNVRKGFQQLLDALQTLGRRRDLFLLVVGDAHKVPDAGFPSLRVGHVQAVAFLRQVYSAAHLFVIPSLEDNQPNTVLEAMACGSPVVGFNVDGIPEMVVEGRTGLLAERGNVQKLGRAIEFLIDNEPERARMGVQARQRIEEVFKRDQQVQKYLDLYARLVGRQAPTRAFGEKPTASLSSSIRNRVETIMNLNA